MHETIENIKEQVLIKWLKSQTEYVGDYDGEYNLDSVCLDGWFNLEELSSLIADEVLKVVKEVVIDNTPKHFTREYRDTDKMRDDIIKSLSNLSPNKENENNG